MCLVVLFPSIVILHGIFCYSTVKWSINRFERFWFILHTWWYNNWADEESDEEDDETEEMETLIQLSNFDDIALRLFLAEEMYFMHET